MKKGEKMQETASAPTGAKKRGGEPAETVPKMSHDEAREVLRPMLDAWAAWYSSRRSGSSKSAIADVGRYAAAAANSPARLGSGRVAVRDTRVYTSSIPAGVEASEEITRIDRALKAGTDSGFSEHMRVVKACHLAPWKTGERREQTAVDYLVAMGARRYPVRTMQTLRAIGEAYLIARLL